MTSHRGRGSMPLFEDGNERDIEILPLARFSSSPANSLFLIAPRDCEKLSGELESFPFQENSNPQLFASFALSNRRIINIYNHLA